MGKVVLKKQKYGGALYTPCVFGIVINTKLMNIKEASKFVGKKTF